MFQNAPLTTCSGGAGAADLAAFLVERHLGVAVKQKTLQVLQIERARALSDPQPRSPLALDVQDNRVRRALLIIEQTISISNIARKCGLSTRALERIFNDAVAMRPNEAYLTLRLRAARDLVVGTKKTMTEIGVETGFPHSSNFSHRFKEAFGGPLRVHSRSLYSSPGRVKCDSFC
jgi:transcriptional regulator GlxA family with amidase domain